MNLPETKRAEFAAYVNPKAWENEIWRSRGQGTYWKDYRNAQTRLSYAVMAIDIELSANYVGLTKKDKEECIQLNGERLGRHLGYYINKKTGRPYSTRPETRTLNAIRCFTGTPPKAALTPHIGDIERAYAFAQDSGYNRLADQTLLAATLRGSFFSEEKHRGFVLQHILLCHQLKGERIFRVRWFKVSYEKHPNEVGVDFANRIRDAEFDMISVMDTFAMIGTNYGFEFDPMSAGTESTRRLQFETFFEKGRRVRQFSMTSGSEAGSIYTLATDPKMIRKVRKILESASR